jgi:thiamine biosynthesis protein ThiI
MEKEKKCIICHYSEVALKGKNRCFFERQLVLNIKKILPEAKISSPRGRIVILSDESNLEEKLKKVCGIEHFFFAERVPSSFKDIKEKILLLCEKKEFKTFRVTVKRADKLFPIKSPELSALLGEEIIKKTKKEVNLSSPDVTFFVEINLHETYMYFQKTKGVGGLPVGTGGKVISLISGGIDSPVASFRIIKRGAKAIFVHFHAYPATSKQSIEKVKRLTEKLSLFQGESSLYLVPFNEIQKEIMINTKESLRVLLYRRFMMRIAEEIAKRERAKAIITGESLGQVASQTVENIAITGGGISLPILRPLIGFDKEEIISEAIRIETYNISILPEDDCCVRFLPKYPETKGNILDIKKEEEKLDIEKMQKEAISRAEKVIIVPPSVKSKI